jgi:aspartyl-tRNA(Asn)/glutamyl-tRNA(Gln) amidotransferase subunit A
MQYTSLIQIQTALLAGELTTADLVAQYLNNIDKSLHLNAYIEVYREEAMQAAIQTDEKLKNSPDQLGKLFGCVISIKDLICYKNHHINAGSKILTNFESQFSATAVAQVLQEGAIIIGRTNCDEFGMGSANTNSYFGPVKNAIDTHRISGGSSGGAAVSVQAHTCLIALGTDTGGSVRQPASMCGVIGYKPTYGVVSRHGLIAYASSFDQLGIFAHHAEDIDAIMSVVSVVDEYDATMFQSGIYKEQMNQDVDFNKLKVAYFDEAIENKALDPEIKKAFYTYIATLEAKGVQVEKIKFPLLSALVPCYYILTTAEASSNLSRYDGARYGYRAADVTTLEDMYVKSRSEGFGNEVKKRIMLGSFVLSEAYYDAYFTKAQQVRQLIKNQLNDIFATFDFIIMPTSPSVAWPIDATPTDPLEAYMADIYTVLANLGGLPAISIPLGTDAQNLAFGLQVIGNVKDDKKLLSYISY